MEQKKTSTAFTVASIISLVLSGLAVVCLLFLIPMYLFAGSGGSSTAVTNEAVLGIAGAILLVGGSMIFGAVGAIMGIVMTIIGIVKKYFSRIWMPILSIVLGAVPYFVLLLMAILL